jgi:hypothetical protein
MLPVYPRLHFAQLASTDCRQHATCRTSGFAALKTRRFSRPFRTKAKWESRKTCVGYTENDHGEDFNCRN